MTRPPRWLKLLGILAVGFVIGRYTAEPREDVIKASRPAIAEDVPLTVDIAVSGDQSLQDPSNSGMPSALSDGVSNSEPDPAGSTTDAGDDFASFVGTWYAETSHGPRLSVLKEDGTGTIDAKLDWLAAMFYGQQLQLNVDWVITSAAPTDDESAVVKVEPGTLSMIHTVTSGTPVKNVEALTRDFGAIKEYYIRSHTDDEMVLVDPGDGEVITWIRREPGSTLQ